MMVDQSNNKNHEEILLDHHQFETNQNLYLSTTTSPPTLQNRWSFSLYEVLF